MTHSEGFPLIPEQPDDHEQARELDALVQDCQDELEKDERYREQDKLVRCTAPEWAGKDGVHFQAYLRGSHTYSPEGRYIGHSLELGLQAAYPFTNLIPHELQQLADDHEEALPPAEKIQGILGKYMFTLNVSPLGTFAWNEQRSYEVCFELDDADVPEYMREAAPEEMETVDGEAVISLQPVSDVLYVCPVSSGNTAKPMPVLGVGEDAAWFQMLETQFSDIVPGTYLEFGKKVLRMVQTEDEGALGLARIFPEEIVNKILQLS